MTSTIAAKLSPSLRTHLVLRTYIAEARNERRDDVELADENGEPLMDTIYWDEPKTIAQIFFKAFGYSAREQFNRCIVEQPSRIANWLICSKLRGIYGDLSDIDGFDVKGNFIRGKYCDALQAVYDGRYIVRLEPLASRQVAKG